jgi:DNA modification methylase
MKPYYEHAGITIYHGDCREILESITDSMVISMTGIVTDPPYGMDWDTDTSRFSGGSQLSVARRGGGKKSPAIRGDDAPFDPSPWAKYGEAILFGYNHFAPRVAPGTLLVWIKRLDGAFGSFLSDAEVAWMKGGHGVYCWRDLGMAALAASRLHPSEKPVSLMSWCISRLKATNLILDPFMGSGTTLVAAKELGRRAIGIEIEERYCEIAAKRLRQEVFAFTA